MAEQKEIIYSSRVSKLLHESQNPKIIINEASKSFENHGHLSYIIYTIIIGSNNDLIVKRRYSEFEILRNCLIKSFPYLIIPPIPEKQSLKSNIETTTGLKNSSANVISNNNGSNTGANGTNAINNGPSNTANLTNTNSNNTNNLSNPNHNHLLASPSVSSSTSNSTANQSNYIEYRKRMLSVFLNRCLSIKEVSNNSFFLSFLDPEVNFNDLIDNSKEFSSLLKLSIHRLNPLDPLKDLNNQLYLTLPIPSSNTGILSNQNDPSSPDSNSSITQIENCRLIEIKFQRYENVFNSISKINKKLRKSLIDISPDYVELSNYFNSLSLIQDSNYIESLAKVIGRNYEIHQNFSNLIQLKVLDKVIELKNFNKAVTYLIEYNKQKIIQLNMVEQLLKENQAKLKEYERQDEEIRKIDNRINQRTQTGTEAPITDQELQSSLYLQSQRASSFIKIPGMSKLNNLVQSITDQNPEQTRQKKLHNTKLKNYQLLKQKELLTNDNKLINEKILKELDSFYNWFKLELTDLIKNYNQFLVDSLYDNIEAWEEHANLV